MSSLLRDIDAILTRGSKETSYKFAVLRAMAEWVIEHPLQKSHRIPVSWMAYRILPWYVHEGKYAVPHGRQSARTPEIVAGAERIAAAVGGPIAFEKAWVNQRLPLSRELLAIRKKLVQQPLNFLRNLDGRVLDFYQLEGTREGLKLPQPVNHAWKGIEDFLQQDSCIVVLNEDVTAQLAPLRFMIRDVTIQQWATWSEELSKHRGIRPYILTALKDPSPTRRSTRPAAQAFDRLGLNRRCILTAGAIRRLHVDHFIPWSVYPCHDYSNLVPCDSEANAAKSDRLPWLTEPLERRLRNHYELMLSSGDPWMQYQPEWPSANALVNHVAKVLENLREITGRPHYVPAT